MPLTELETRFRRRNDKCEVMDESLRLTSYSFQSPKQAQKICKNFRELFTNGTRTSSKMVIPLLHCQHIKKNGTLSQQSTYVISTVYACLSVVRCFRYFIEMANGIDNFFANRNFAHRTLTEYQRLYYFENINFICEALPCETQQFTQSVKKNIMALRKFTI